MGPMKRGVTASFVIAALLPAGAHAHHAIGAVYDASQPVTLEGAITAFHYVNPHPFVEIQVVATDGRAESVAPGVRQPQRTGGRRHERGDVQGRRPHYRHRQQGARQEPQRVRPPSRAPGRRFPLRTGRQQPARSQSPSVRSHMW